MLGFGLGEVALGEIPLSQSLTITTIGWFGPFTDPIRIPNNLFSSKYGLATTQQQFFSFDSIQLVSFSYFQSLTLPVRQALRNPAALGPPFETQGTDFLPHPQNLLEGWYSWLSEPKRFKPLLITPEHPFIFLEPLPPIYTTTDWYSWLSDPVRLKQGLSVTLQQTLAYHPRPLPKANITATLSAFELNTDTAQFAIYVIQSQPAASANVSITEVVLGQSATSVRER